MRQRVNLRSPLFLQYESRPAEVESTNLITDSEEFSTWSKQSVSISSNDIEAPDGNITADKIESTSSSINTYAYDTISLSTSTEYSASVYIKRGSSGLATVDVFDLTSGVQGSALFNFDSNTITSSIGSVSFENASNGWYRIKISFTSSSTLGTTFFRVFEYSSISGNHIYSWGAQLEESSQVTSYIATSGGTVTRAATTEAQEEDVTAELRVYSGGGGYNYERTNLQVRSEEFDNAAWGKTRTTVTANQVEAPDGTLTADKLECNTTGGSSSVTDSFSITAGDTITSSVFFKKGNSDYFSFGFLDSSFGSGYRVIYDLNNNNVTYNVAFGSEFSNESYSIENHGGGWYRASATATSSTTTTIRNFIYAVTDGGSTFAATQGEYNYFWGFQSEISEQSTSYIKTEAAAVTELAYQTEAPTEATYTLTKSPENGKTTFEIAELVRDYIEQTTTKSSGTIWADVKLFDNLQMNRYYYFLGTEGYIDNTEGLQTYLNAPSNETFMQSNSTVLIPEGQSLEIPVNAQYNSFYTITTGGVEGSAVYFSNLDDNSTQVEYITVDSTDEVVKLYVDSVVTEEITIQETECSKYSDHLLMFVNKYGSKQDFYVNMKSTEKFKVKADGFSRSVIDYNTLSVNNGIHSYKRRVLESKESYSLNTPFLDEENVQAFEELLLSEYVWLKKEGADYIPVIVKDMSMTRKTHLNDKLIQYTVEVESANHLVNKQR